MMMEKKFFYTDAFISVANSQVSFNQFAVGAENIYDWPRGPLTTFLQELIKLILFADLR